MREKKGQDKLLRGKQMDKIRVGQGLDKLDKGKTMVRQWLDKG